MNTNNSAFVRTLVFLRHYLYRHKQKTFKIVLVFLTIFMFSVVFNQFSYFVNRVDLFSVKEGMTAVKDIISDREIIFTDIKATEARQEAARSLVPPVFVINNEFTAASLNDFNYYADSVMDFTEKKYSIEKIYFELQRNLPGRLNREVLESFLKIKTYPQALKTARQIFSDIMRQGVIKLPPDWGVINRTDFLSIYSQDDDKLFKNEMLFESAVTDESFYSIFENRLKTHFRDPQLISALIKTSVLFFMPNAYYSKQLTDENTRKALETVEPVTKKINKNEKIIKKGTAITSKDIEKLVIWQSVAQKININNILGIMFSLIVIAVMCFILFSPPFIEKKLKMQQFNLITGIILVYSVLVSIIYGVSFIPDNFTGGLFQPAALVSMLVTILAGKRTSLVLSIMLALLTLVLSRFDQYSFFFVFLSGTTASVIVAKAQKRMDLINSTVTIAFVNVFIVILIGLFKAWTVQDYLIPFTAAALNGFICGILNLGILPVFEHFMNAPTVFKLMELSDINAPMMKRMLTLAPGTYGHSLNVANLAESACREIGADPLLARVGAYYHDIGKIDQAEYFIENQTDYNKHDELKPSLSAAVIKSHLKIGVEKGRELDLPEEVVDIIAQHHGTGLITYFYSEALKESGAKVSPEDYSYTGEQPQSREAAAVMLADSVEAASRTLKKPTISKLDRFVWQLISEKFLSGQLNSCDLTFKDLEAIKKIFVQILAGQFHSRIEYPKIQESR